MFTRDFPMLRRRDCLFMAGALAAVPATAASGPFWNTKEPSEWSEAEVDTLITSSPWAQCFRLSMAGTPEEYGPPVSHIPSNTGGGWGIPGTIGLPRPSTSGPYPRSTRTQVEGIVRWESALPILDALRTRVPDEFKHCLVISLNGIPAENDSAGRRTFDPETIRQSVRLDYGGAAHAPELVQNAPLSTGMTRTVLSGFSSGKVRLSASSGNIVFHARISGTPFKVRFKSAEMIYRGKFTA